MRKLRHARGLVPCLLHAAAAILAATASSACRFRFSKLGSFSWSKRPYKIVCQQLASSARMSRVVKRACGFAAGKRENLLPASRMIPKEARYVVHIAIDHNPAALLSVVLVHVIGSHAIRLRISWCCHRCGNCGSTSRRSRRLRGSRSHLDAVKSPIVNGPLRTSGSDQRRGRRSTKKPRSDPRRPGACSQQHEGR